MGLLGAIILSHIAEKLEDAFSDSQDEYINTRYYNYDRRSSNIKDLEKELERQHQEELNRRSSNIKDLEKELERQHQEKLKRIVKKIYVEKKRSITPCDWTNISEKEFKDIAISHGKGIKRLWIQEVKGAKIICTVKSTSGISSWGFTVDFNDWGLITGEYELFKDNSDSSIPRVYADKVAQHIRMILKSNPIDKEKIKLQRSIKWKAMEKCQYCGGEFEEYFFIKRCVKCKKKKDY